MPEQSAARVMGASANPLAALDALGARRARRRTRLDQPIRERSGDEEPFDRRIRAKRQLSVTGLLDEDVDTLSIRASYSGIILSTNVFSGLHVQVRTIGTRREVWMRGRKVREILRSVGLDPAPRRHDGRRNQVSKGRSIKVDVYRRVLPGAFVELDILPRGMPRSL